MEQADHAQRLPGVLTRAKGALRLIASFLKLIQVDPLSNGSRWAIIKLLFELGDPIPELSLPGVAFLLPGTGQIPPHRSVDAAGFQHVGAMLVARRARSLAGPVVGPGDVHKAFTPRPQAARAGVPYIGARRAAHTIRRVHETTVCHWVPTFLAEPTRAATG
jgi:hypothetical protein